MVFDQTSTLTAMILILPDASPISVASTQEPMRAALPELVEKSRDPNIAESADCGHLGDRHQTIGLNADIDSFRRF